MPVLLDAATKDVFLKLLLRSKALDFGSFKTKSGRNSPFFFNFGMICDGDLLSNLGQCYADAILKISASKNPILYGPAYKGITLAATTSNSLFQKHNMIAPFVFNRKEQKLHGEGGSLVGYPLKPGDQVIIIEDVMTGGTSVRETLALLTPMGIRVEAVLIGVDRQERGLSEMLATEEINKQYGVPVYSILTIKEIVARLALTEFMGRVWINEEMLGRISSYQQLYGAKN